VALRNASAVARNVASMLAVSSPAIPRFRAVFFGTPAFAVPCLDALRDIADVSAVVCQPDRPQGRGLALAAPAVKVRALELGLPVVQPTKVRTPEMAEWLSSQRADVAVVVAYGRILPPALLTAPRLGCVNVHASLLPRWRGAAPITWSIVKGDAQTGITLMQMDEGMDTGAMLEQVPTPIDPNETAGQLSERLSAMGAEALRRVLPRFVQGVVAATPQDHALATLAPMLTKQDGCVDFTCSSQDVHNHIRGMHPWPGAYTWARGKTLKVLSAEPAVVARSFSTAATPDAPGTVVFADRSAVIVACGEGAVRLLRVQLEGKKAISAGDWFVGRGVHEGERLGEPKAS